MRRVIFRLECRLSLCCCCHPLSALSQFRLGFRLPWCGGESGHLLLLQADTVVIGSIRFASRTSSKIGFRFRSFPVRGALNWQIAHYKSKRRKKKPAARTALKFEFSRKVRIALAGERQRESMELLLGSHRSVVLSCLSAVCSK